MVLRYGKNKALPFSVLKFHVRFRGRRLIGLRCETFLETALLALLEVAKETGSKVRPSEQSHVQHNTDPV